jgi:hypothetical protein
MVQSIMDNPETLATLGAQNTGGRQKQTYKKNKKQKTKIKTKTTTTTQKAKKMSNTDFTKKNGK